MLTCCSELRKVPPLSEQQSLLSVVPFQWPVATTLVAAFSEAAFKCVVSTATHGHAGDPRGRVCFVCFTLCVCSKWT